MGGVRAQLVSDKCDLYANVQMQLQFTQNKSEATDTVFCRETLLKTAEAEAKGFTAQAVCLGALPNQTEKSEQLGCRINNSLEMLYIAELSHIGLNMEVLWCLGKSNGLKNSQLT